MSSGLVSWSQNLIIGSRVSFKTLQALSFWSWGLGFGPRVLDLESLAVDPDQVPVPYFRQFEHVCCLHLLLLEIDWVSNRKANLRKYDKKNVVFMKIKMDIWS